MLHRFATIQKFGGADLPDRTIIVVASDDTLDRAGDVMAASGCDATNFRKNPVVLKEHDPSLPIGKASVIVKGARLEATITFAPKGVSKTADETYALVKAGILNAVSIGFKPIESAPLSGGGRKLTRWNCSRFRSSPCPQIKTRSSSSAHIAPAPRRCRPPIAGRHAAALKCIEGVIACHDDMDAMREKPPSCMMTSTPNSKRPPTSSLVRWATWRACRQDATDAADESKSVSRAGHLRAAGAYMRALKSAHAHINALSVTRTALLEAWRDRLDDANALVSKAMAHLRRLGGDDDADSELSAAIERQKRERIIFALQAGAGSPLPSVPEAFKVIDVARQIRAIVCHLARTPKEGPMRRSVSTIGSIS